MKLNPGIEPEEELKIWERRANKYWLAYEILDDLLTGALPQGTQVSSLFNDRSPEMEEATRSALMLLAGDEYIEICRHKDAYYRRGGVPQCIFYGPKIRGKM